MTEQMVKVFQVLKNIFPDKEEGLLLSIIEDPDNRDQNSAVEELVIKCVEQILEGEESAERRLKEVGDEVQGTSKTAGSSSTDGDLIHRYRDMDQRAADHGAAQACVSDVSVTESLPDVSQSPKSSSSFGISKLAIDIDGERRKLVHEDGGKRERMNEWLSTCVEKEEETASGEEGCEDKSDTSTEKPDSPEPFTDDCSDSDLEVISLESPEQLLPDLKVDRKSDLPDLQPECLSEDMLDKESIVPCSGSVIEVYDSDTATLRASLDTNDSFSDSFGVKEECCSDGMNTERLSPDGADIPDDVIHIPDTPLKGVSTCDNRDVIDITDTPQKDAGSDSDITDSATCRDVDDEGTSVSPVQRKSLIDVSDIVKLESPTRRVASSHIYLSSPEATASPSHDHLDLNHAGDVSGPLPDNSSECPMPSNKTVSFIDEMTNRSKKYERNKVTFDLDVCKQNSLPSMQKRDILPHEVACLQSVQKRSEDAFKSVSRLPCKSIILKRNSSLSNYYVTSSDSEGSVTAPTSDNTPCSISHDTRPVQSVDISTSSSVSVPDPASSVKPLSKGILKKRKHGRIDKNQLNEQLKKLREKSSNSFHNLFAYNDDLREVFKKAKRPTTWSSGYLEAKHNQDRLAELSQLFTTRKWVESVNNVSHEPSQPFKEERRFAQIGMIARSADEKSADRDGLRLKEVQAGEGTRETSRLDVRPPVSLPSHQLPHTAHQPNLEAELEQIVTIFPDVDRTWASRQLQKLKMERPADFLNQMCLLMADSGYEKQDEESKANKGKGKHKSVNVKGMMDKIRTSQRYVDVLSAIGEEAYEIRRQGRKRPSDESMDVSDVPVKVPVREEEVDSLPDIPDFKQGEKPLEGRQAEDEKPEESEGCLSRLQCEGCSLLADMSTLSQCNEGHVLCHSCVEECVKKVFAQESKITITCLIGECKSEIRLADAKKVLPKIVVDLLQERIDKQERSSISKMSGVVSCPDCGVSVMMENYDKQFHCPNTDCMLACCRYCKRAWNETSHSYCSPILSVPTQDTATQHPPHWTRLPPGFTEDFIKIVVPPGSMEFTVIQSHFKRTMSEFSITTLSRIQNPKLWQKYALTRSHILEETGAAKLNEQHLFHGTKPEVVESICREGFDWRLCGQHGTAYGQGSYFATEANYSHRYSSLPNGFNPHPNRRHFQFIGQNPQAMLAQTGLGVIPLPDQSHQSQQPMVLLVARVVSGRYTQGRNGMRRPPIDREDPKQRPFNSVVNNHFNPSIFVTFDSSQSYPEYVVEYSHRVFTG